MDLKTSTEWSQIIYKEDYPRFIMDPDGWDRKNFIKSWNEPITVVEYQSRVCMSTLSNVALAYLVDNYILRIKNNCLEAKLKERELEVNQLKSIIADVSNARKKKNIGYTGGGDPAWWYDRYEVEDALSGLGPESKALEIEVCK